MQIRWLKQMENEFFVRYIKLLPHHEYYVLYKYGLYRARELGKYIYGIYAPSLEIKICEITLKQLNYHFEKVK